MNTQLHQTVTLWRVSGLNEEGEPTYSDPVEISARWESRVQRFQHQDGTDHSGNCVIYAVDPIGIDDKVLLGGRNALALAILSGDTLAEAELDLDLPVGGLATLLAMANVVPGFPYSLLTPFECPSVRTIGMAQNSPSVCGYDSLAKYIGE